MKPGKTARNDETQQNETERETRRNLYDMRNEHFYTDKQENRTDSLFEVDKFFHKTMNDKKERP